MFFTFYQFVLTFSGGWGVSPLINKGFYQFVFWNRQKFGYFYQWKQLRCLPQSGAEGGLRQ